jgi:hypothetical protein
MNNLEKLKILGTQDTGRRQTKQKHNPEKVCTSVLEQYVLLSFHGAGVLVQHT